MANRQSAIPPRRGGRAVLGALREAQIVSSKPFLPAEILSSILDFIGPEELIACARVSKRMREMVYDDTRWVRRLQLMGCWDESAARKHVEVTLSSRLSHVSQRNSQADLHTKKNTNSKDAPLIMLNSPTTPTKPKLDKEATSSDSAKEPGDSIGTSTGEASSANTVIQLALKDPALCVFEGVQSKRGLARREYGRIHGILAPLFKDAVRSKNPSDAKVFRTYRDPEHQGRMLAQLVKFSQADVSSGWMERAANMSAVNKAFEDAVFTEFEDGLRQNDKEGKMKKYAHVLFYLNGGDKAIATFLNQIDIVTSPYRLGDPSEWITMDGNRKFKPDEYLAFLRKLAAAIHEHCDTIDQVFPQAANVVEPFIEKLSSVVFARYLEKLFQMLLDINSEQYVKAVPGTFLQNLGFLETVRTAPRLGESKTLERNLKKIYEPFVERYLEEELAWFKKRSDAEVTGWERQLSQQDASIEAMYMAGVNRQADKRDFLTSFKKVVMAPVNILPVMSFGGRNASMSAASNGLNPSSRSTSRPERGSSPGPWPVQGLDSNSKRSSRSPSPGGDPPSTELEAKAAIMQTRLEGIKSLFSLEVALSLVHMAKASIERAAIFAKNLELHQESARVKCETLFVQLLMSLGERHVRSGFNQAVEHLSNYNPRAVEQRKELQMVAPLVTFLELVNVGDLIQQMIDVFYEQELVATRLTDKNDFLSLTVKGKRKFEQMLDERVAAGLNKGIEVLIAEVEYIFATTQTAEDFNPGAAGKVVNQIIEIDSTNTAKWIVELISQHTKMLTGSTDKNMLDVFNQEVGLRLFGTLCKHLKRQRVSILGAPRLMSDMNQYFIFIQTLKNKDLQQYFKALCELSQIYLIDGSNAKELATVIADHDRYSGIFGAEEVLEFAQRRADWYQVRPKVEKAMYGIGCAVM